MAKLPEREGAIAAKVPGASSTAVALLAKMLVFNPADRISVKDAIEDPWLETVREVDKLELQSPSHISVDDIETMELSKENLRRKVRKKAHRFSGQISCVSGTYSKPSGCLLARRCLRRSFCFTTRPQITYWM